MNDPIRVSYDPPPIPLRSFDWRACRDSYDLGSPCGYGPTREAAIADLLGQEDVQKNT